MLPMNVKITKIVEETPSNRTFFFDYTFDNALKGQFVMIWIRGFDEIPMTLSYTNAITVQKVGDATSKMFELEEGDYLGIRGPYGNGFTIPDENAHVLIISGGVGAASLAPLAEFLVLKNSKITTILGARNSDELMFTDRFFKCGQVLITTDDGSAYRCGFVTDILNELDITSYDYIFTCGPELMMKKVLDILCEQKITERAEFSLHRYFKCAIGVCGACCMDNSGLRVCKDGPVFNGNTLIDTEFGFYMREASGKKTNFKNIH